MSEGIDIVHHNNFKTQLNVFKLLAGLTNSSVHTDIYNHISTNT